MTDKYEEHIDDCLSWLDKPKVSESISGIKWVKHEPQTQHTLNDGGDIIIDIQGSDEYLLPSKSYLLFKGQLRKRDNTLYDGTEQIALVNNAMMYLFNTIKYSLGGTDIETITRPGQATSIMEYLRQPDDYSTSAALSSCWSKDTTNFADSNKYSPSPAVAGVLTPVENPNYNQGFAARRGLLFSSNPLGNFEFKIPLDRIFGFAESYEKIIYSMKHTLTLTRLSEDNLAIYRHRTTDGKVDLKRISWVVPHVKPDPPTTMMLRKNIMNKDILHLNYFARSVQSINVPQASTNFSWRLSVCAGIEKPRWIIIAFQTDKNTTQLQNPAIFDNVHLSRTYVTLNSEKYPQTDIINNFELNNYAELYSMFDNFKKEHYGYNSLSGGTQVSFPAFKSLFPIIVFDVRHQSEQLKYGIADIQFTCEFLEGIPANTTAYSVILSDRFYKLKSDGQNLQLITS